ncbi:molybdopterin-dependent oxidoreductase [Ruminococcaceae bacterium OttesenSCG-928-I18]|nr:molybdopterin-dependent oxidoreductase [Ruminococcaceae bacterium OttesenSCG-928-I18]
MEEITKLRKLSLVVNGSPCSILVEKGTRLVDVIRTQLGLTGTKVGCRLNQCGVCNVILNGKVVRSCVTSIDKVPDGAELTTIEGVGTPECPHPIQMAWAKFGAAQCGFCTPGFIISAYALLLENQNPTREEVREQFRQCKNACRCTGYKPIVDAVMCAAQVLRGELKPEDLEFKMPEDGRLFGTAYPRQSSLPKACGTWDFGADTGLKMPGDMLQVAMVQAKVSHANILSIDKAEAEKMPGVEMIITHKDIKGTNRIDNLTFYPWTKGSGFDRPILCDEKVFQYGDAIALVLADTKEHALAAADKVVVEVEELPAYMSAPEAVAEDAVEIHPGYPNMYSEQPSIKGEDPRELFKDPDVVVVEQDYYTQRVPHLILEPDVGYAYYDEDGLLTIHSKSVNIYLHRDMIAEGLGLKPEEMRLIQNNAGATMGYKLAATLEAMLGAAVMASGKPCYLEYDMAQQITYTGKRSPFFMHLAMGADKKTGKLVGLDANFLIDHGAYSEIADLLLTRGNQFIGSGYHLPNLRNYGRITATNHAYGAPMRGYGSPQALFATESIIDELARELGEDPFEFRMKNLYTPESTTPYGNKHDELVYEELMGMIRPYYEAAKKRKAEFSEENKKYGLGLSLAIYCVGDETADASDAAMGLLPDGKFAMYNTWEDHGQGADIGALTLTQEALHRNGIHVTPEEIVLVSNDTKKCPNSSGAAGSRSQLITGNAIYDAAEKLVNAMRKEDGSYRTYDEMVAEGIDTYYLGSFTTGNVCKPLDHKTGMCEYSHIAFMYGVFLSEVVVDVTTGKTEVKKVTVAVDAGVIGNKLAVDGQYYGGIAQGVGMALSEDFEDIQNQNTLLKCGLPTIDVIPDDMELLYLETPRKHSKFQSSGCGEVVLSSPHASIINALADACGARIRNLPAYPEKVLEALKNA